MTAEIAEQYRSILSEDDHWRCGFLGHLSMELLLDAAIIEQDEDRLTRFYECLGEVDSDRVQRLVTSVATREVDRLSGLIGLFVKEQFLNDYLTDERLLFRINQVMARVGLNRLPDQTVEVLAVGREIVRSSVSALLPEEHFPERLVLGRLS